MALPAKVDLHHGVREACLELGRQLRERNSQYKLISSFEVFQFLAQRTSPMVLPVDVALTVLRFLACPWPCPLAGLMPALTSPSAMRFLEAPAVDILSWAAAMVESCSRWSFLSRAAADEAS